ncbi:MAG TPA: hypothetical protein VFV67_35400 [Actinophytocola sp.]|uniref:hypothetical protein n=1 Tax=Actinophytocola sp. TaxID=1872138 RepID=UPI002DBCC633|nr:hypothetical protein [Actinophytocola sp.]HEU5475942.1 hypothetical protein [Actinophytocola sp.]
MAQAIGMSGPTMRADGKQLVGARPDLASVLGTWENTKPYTDHIAMAEINEREGRLFVRIYGAPTEDPVDWGEVEAHPYAFSGTTKLAGWVASYQLGDVRTELAANEKFGVTVIQSFTSFHDGSDRCPHFAREFFGRRGRVVGPAPGRHPFQGTWVNTYADTKWIAGYTFKEIDGRCFVHIRGAREPEDWGEVEAVGYWDNINEPAWHATYDLGEIEALLCANSNHGLTIICLFLRSKDSGKTNFLCREFYFRNSI